MPGPITIIVPLALAAVLVASAIAKLRHPDDVDGWAALGVPAVFRRTWLVRLHPWGEIALAVGLVAFGGMLGMLAALAAVVLMVAYLWLVVRAMRQTPDASCACFGEHVPITRATVVRNVWLTGLAALAVATTWSNPLWGGAFAAVGADGWVWLAGAAIAAATAVVVMWADLAGARAATPAPVEPQRVVSTGGEDDLDYIRTRTPAVPVTQADGTVVNLRKLAMQKPILLLALSEMCGACEPVRERAQAYRDLLPEVDVRLLLGSDPGRSSWVERTEPQSLHDTSEYVSGSIQDWGTPSAVLLGIDGLLAGGPVTGTDAIEQFIADVYESLHGVPPEQTATVAADAE